MNILGMLAMAVLLVSPMHVHARAGSYGWRLPVPGYAKTGAYPGAGYYGGVNAGYPGAGYYAINVGSYGSNAGYYDTDRRAGQIARRSRQLFAKRVNSS